MSMAAKGIEAFIADFDQVEAALPGAGDAVVDRLRRDALGRLRERGLPTTRDEEWKYTNVAAITRRSFRPSAGARPPEGAALDALLERARLPGALALVFVNGRLDAGRSDLASLPEGLSLRPLGTALAEVATELPAAESGFDDLNLAFLTDGAHLSVAPGLELARPLQLLFVALPGSEALAVHQAVMLTLGEHARLGLIETHIGEGEALSTSVTRVRLAAGARLERCKVEWGANRAYHIGRTLYEQQRDSEVLDHSISFGALLARHDVQVALREPGARCTLNGLYLADGRRHVDHHTRVDHLAPHTHSDEIYRGVLDGGGRAVFNGKVVVHSGADKTDARQANHNLLLSAHAEVDTKPELQIYADDVKCAHGATVGQLSDEALFYLRSRAIDERTARGFLIYAFAVEALARIGMAPVRHSLRHLLAGMLNAPAELEQLQLPGESS